MTNVFDNINTKNKEKLLYSLEADKLNFKANTSILSLIKDDNIIGIILNGYLEIIRTDHNANRTIIEELYDGDIFGTMISSLNNNEYDIITKEETTIILLDYNRLINFSENSKSYYNEFIKNWLDNHRLRRRICVRQSGRFSTPLTYGIFCPVILMPASVKWGDTKSLEYVLAHEYVHIRRFDSIFKLVLIMVLCIHWFNPLVWVMYLLSNRDIELSCDESVIRQFGEKTRAEYALLLISMEEKRGVFAPLCSKFSRSAAEERIVSIMKYKKVTALSFALGFTLVFGVTTAFATTAKQSENRFVTDEDGSVYSVSENNLRGTEQFYIDENGKYTRDTDRVDWMSEFGIMAPEFVIPDNPDNNEYSFQLTPEGIAGKEQDILAYKPLRTEEEMQQIIADIESGKIKGYRLEDFESGNVPGFEVPEGADFSVGFVEYADGTCTNSGRQ